MQVPPEVRALRGERVRMRPWARAACPFRMVSLGVVRVLAAGSALAFASIGHGAVVRDAMHGGAKQSAADRSVDVAAGADLSDAPPVAIDHSEARPVPASLDREQVEKELDELRAAGRIDEPLKRRALDVLFSQVRLSPNDAALKRIFESMLRAEGDEREQLVARFSNDVVRALDRALAVERWDVAKEEGRPKMHATLEQVAPELAQRMQLLVEQGYPVQVRDLKTGIIFRLVPGGWMPGRGQEPAVLVEPYYIACAEVDECDWFRCKGGTRASLLPVEGKTWVEVDAFLTEMGLSLPTREEWEFAARSGMATDFWMGSAPQPGEIRCKVDDRKAAVDPVVGAGEADLRGREDFRRNYFSLFHVHGNVAEWCRHPLGRISDVKQPACGGSYRDPWQECGATSSRLIGDSDSAASVAVGFRPVRRIRPGFTSIEESSTKRPLRVVVVDDHRALEIPWRAKVWRESPDPEMDRLDPEYCRRVQKTGLPWEVEDLETNLRLRLVPAMEFTVPGNEGAGTGERSDAVLGVRVLVTQPFYLGTSEVSEEDWRKLIDEKVEGVMTSRSTPIERTWDQCRDYLRAARNALRFPNEYEWQLACTLGRDRPFAFGGFDAVDGSPQRCNDRSHGSKHLGVGQMYESPFGFRGMHGNAAEWCNNRWDLDSLVPKAEDRPTSVRAGLKSIRGGSMRDARERCTASARASGDFGGPKSGFRIARSVPAHRDLFIAEWTEESEKLRERDDVERPRPGQTQNPDGSNPSEKKSEPEGKDPGAAPSMPTETEREPQEQDEKKKQQGGQGMIPGKNNGQGGGNPPPPPPGDGKDGDSPGVPDGPTETNQGG